MSHYDGYYLTGDAGFIDDDGYLSIMSRIDDIINVAGHRLSTGGMEEVLSYHPDVAECAVIGVSDTLKGQLPIGFVVLNAGAAIYVAGLAGSLKEGVQKADQAIASGEARNRLDRLVVLTQSF